MKDFRVLVWGHEREGGREGESKREKNLPLVMRKELTQEMVTYGTDLLCPGLPIQISLYPQLGAALGTTHVCFWIWHPMKSQFQSPERGDEFIMPWQKCQGSVLHPKRRLFLFGFS